ncbi:hypothetical protein JCGZ_14413 [Jatropha curcas]|uniref:Uncharacterized protein n=1 Tax=Jatropha curcas TaxID=180498 RepID=A0A067JXM2_JATCU|nr:protein diaphanous homolog 2 [Jatropha curcas]KDP28642.1 hypothetical protein JCGZ_14413 [Jatropha curcas]
MEEAKPAQDPPTENPNPDPNPPETAPAPPSQSPPPAPATVAAPPPPPPPPPPAPAAGSLPPKTKKRPLESYVQIQECSYFKMRAVLKDIRPHLLEVLRTVNFRSCKGADELREKLNLLMELYKQMTAEAVPAKKSKNAPEGQELSSENGARQKPQEQLQDVKPAEQPQSDQVFAKPSETKEATDLEEQTRYIGGSAFGWNFITFSGNKSVYYGRTKESFRAAQEAL